MKKIKKENEKKCNTHSITIIPSINVEQRTDGAFSYWKDTNGGRISFHVMANNIPIKVDLNEENLKIYNEIVGNNLNDKNYHGIFEIFANKNGGLEKYIKIKKPSRCYNNKSFQIVFLSEGNSIYSPKIYVYSKKKKRKRRAIGSLKRRWTSDTKSDIYDEISALWKMQENIQSQQKQLLQLQRDSHQLQKKNMKLLESIIMSTYSYELGSNVEEEEIGYSSLLPKEWCLDLCDYTFL